MAFCKYCGGSVPDNAEFCPDCGKQLTSVCSGQSVTTDDVPSRREFFAVKGSSAAKKRIGANWISLAAGIGLRLAVIPATAAWMMFPGDLKSQYMGYAFRELLTSATGLCMLMLVLACSVKHWGFAAAAIVLGACKLLTAYPLWVAFGQVALIAAAVIILINTLKLEKEYRVYLDCAFPQRSRN